MAALGLVAYGSSDEEGSDIEDIQDNKKNGDAPTVEIAAAKNLSTVKTKASDDIPISDEEDDYPHMASVSNTGSVASKFMSLPPPSAAKSTDDPFLPYQSSRTPNSAQAPLSGPKLVEDNINSTSTLLPGLPTPKGSEMAQAKAPSSYSYDDELEEEVRPKDYEMSAPKPPVHKPKKRQPVKITVPSLFDNSDDEDEPKAKRPAPSSGKAKLFSLLPEPKNAIKKEANRSLIPHTLGKKPAPAATKSTAKKLPPSGPVGIKATVQKPAGKKPATVSVLRPDLIGHDSDDEEDTGPIDFFGFSKDDAKPADRLTSSKFTFRKDEAIGPALPLAGDVGPMLPEPEPEAMPGPAMIPSTMMMEDDDLEPYGGEVQQYLQDDEFLKMQGKKHRGKEAINIIDVSAADQTDPTEYMKTITEEQQMSSHSRKRKDMPTAQQRRKHHITYLAFQAKERELELKNQWSENRQTRKQTQSKYGF